MHRNTIVLWAASAACFCVAQVQCLQAYCTDGYVVILRHDKSVALPPFSWLRKALFSMDRKTRKALRKLVIQVACCCLFRMREGRMISQYQQSLQLFLRLPQFASDSHSKLVGSAGADGSLQ